MEALHLEARVLLFAIIIASSRTLVRQMSECFQALETEATQLN